MARHEATIPVGGSVALAADRANWSRVQLNTATFSEAGVPAAFPLVFK